jgi:glycosyltransferase involved in cell wall biosynthesis
MAKPASLLFITLGGPLKASSRVRAYWVAQELKEKYKVKLVHGHPLKKFVSFALLIIWHDHIIFQKTYTKHHLKLIKWARFLGKTVFLDIDDAPSRVQNKTTLHYFNSCAKAVNAVLAGSPYLVKQIKKEQPKTYYWPTGIKVSHYQRTLPNKENNPLVIGWIGNGPHYKQDLKEILFPVLNQLAKTKNFRLKLVGVCQDEELHALLKSANFDTMWVDELDWKNPQAVSAAMQDFSIGVYPLRNHPFNQYKCGFKALEYMACGLPVIASPNSANTAIVEPPKNGYIAHNNTEWQRYLNELLANEALRSEIGNNSYQKVTQEYDMPVIAQKLISILNMPSVPKV